MSKLKQLASPIGLISEKPLDENFPHLSSFTGVTHSMQPINLGVHRCDESCVRNGEICLIRGRETFTLSKDGTEHLVEVE